MAKAYFIGGAPRSGKTKTLKKLIETRPVFAASTDSIRETIRGVLNLENNSELFKVARGAFSSQENVLNMRDNPQIVIDHQNKESLVVWKSVLDFARDNLSDEQDVAIGGVAVLPENFATKMEFDFKIVFIVNLDDQTEVIMKHAHENPHDWLHKYDDEVIRAFCVFNRELNRYYYNEAQKYNLPVINVGGDNFHSGIARAVGILCD